MIVLGIVLLLIGYFTSLSILYTIGAILVVVGVVLWILGAVGRPVGGRKVWFSPALPQHGKCRGPGVRGTCRVHHRLGRSTATLQGDTGQGGAHPGHRGGGRRQ